MKLLIGVVGPCNSGKSILKRGLEKNGFQVRHIAQEHSFAPRMWEKIGNPDLLVYLDVSFETTVKRGKTNWTIKDYLIQVDRLENARQSADLRIDTNNKSPQIILDQVLRYVKTI